MKTISRRKFSQLPSWQVIGNTLEPLGWFLEKKQKKIIVFERGRERIIAHSFMPRKWKVDYFVGKRLLDSTGIHDEGFAKVMVMELGVSKRGWA